MTDNRGEQYMKKVIIAMDSFKGSMTSLEAGTYVAMGIQAADSNIQAEIIEIADGGEGSLAALKNGLEQYDEITITVIDTLHRPLQAHYLITSYQGKRTAIIESAAVVGIHLATPSPETIAKGTSYGVGQMMSDAIQKQCEAIIIFLGGTGTSDGGLGCLQALGAQVTTTQSANPLFHLSETIDIHQAQEKFAAIDLIIANDVTNPYLGKTGFAQVFAKQKGADPKQITLMDQQAASFAHQVDHFLDFSQRKGAGAAGGLGGAMLLLGGNMQSGFHLIADLIHLEEKIATSQLVYTGEGKMDAQTAQGKVPYQIGRIAHRYQVPVIGLVGSRTEELGELNRYLTSVFSIQLKPQSLAKSMNPNVAKKSLEILAYSTFRLFQAKKEK